MSAAASTNQVTILALTIHEEMGEKFVKDICGSGNTKTIGYCQVAFDVLAGDPRLNAAWDETVKKANGVVILTRFLDVISLDKIKAIYRRLPAESDLAMAILIIRENDESDFKMSCPVCGQKLWVRDNDAGKRGRCPNCKKAFTLPDQTSLLRAQLALPDSIDVLRVIGGKGESAQAAIEQLLKHIQGGLIETDFGMDQDVLKQSTIRVQINPDEM